MKKKYMKKNTLTLGVDGCTAGWVSVIIKNQVDWKIEIYPTIQKLWGANYNAKLILIDIPIGLRDKGNIPRLCDIAARKFLTRKRSSSIFPTPCRKALDESSYLQANQVNRIMTGKCLSKQTWNITKKIKEVDILLQTNAKTRDVFIESHPELCFTVLANGTPMQYYKKTEIGIKERLTLLNSYWVYEETPLNEGLKKFNRTEIVVDDILDAWILAISATKGRSNLKYLPEDFEYDSTGLPMRMAIPAFN